MGDGSLFDPDEYEPPSPMRVPPGEHARQIRAGEDARDEALGRVDRAANPEWKVLALAAVREVARRRQRFSADDVWGFLPPTVENRALGPIMRAAQSRGWIEATNDFVLTSQSSRHRAPIRVWASRCFEGDG